MVARAVRHPAPMMSLDSFTPTVKDQTTGHPLTACSGHFLQRGVSSVVSCLHVGPALSSASTSIVTHVPARTARCMQWGLFLVVLCVKVGVVCSSY